MMANNYLKRTLILVLLSLLSTSIYAEKAWEGFFDSSFGDFSEELETAKAENKKGILIFFEKEVCPFCARMKRKVLSKKPIQEYYKKHFKIYPVDIEGNVEIVTFEGKTMKLTDFSYKHYNVYASPVFLFVDLNGKELTRYTGVTRDADEFMWLGQYVVDDLYKKMTFSQYRNKKRMQATKVGQGNEKI